MSLNKVFLIGRLGRDPEMFYSQNGVPIVKFSIATGGKKKENDNTEWHNIVVFKKQAEICHQYLQKGSLVFIEGKIQYRKHTDKNGEQKYITEIIAYNVTFLSSNKNNIKTDNPSKQQKEETLPPWVDDDVPF